MMKVKFAFGGIKEFYDSHAFVQLRTNLALLIFIGAFLSLSLKNVLSEGHILTYLVHRCI